MFIIYLYGFTNFSMLKENEKGLYRPFRSKMGTLNQIPDYSNKLIILFTKKFKMKNQDGYMNTGLWVHVFGF